MLRNKLFFLGIIGFLVAASVGCAGAGVVPLPTPTPTPMPTPISSAEVSQRVQMALDSIQTLQGTALITARTTTATTTVRSQVWFKRPQSTKLQVIDSPDGGIAPGTILVFDGQVLSIYDPTTNRVTRIEDITQAIGLLTVPGNMNMLLVQLIQLRPFLVDLNTTLHDFNAAIVGTDVIAGRPTNILILTPTQPKQTIKYIRLWVGQEDWMPLKIQTISPDDVTTLDSEFEQVSTNIPISNDVFTITPAATPTATVTNP